MDRDGMGEKKQKGAAMKRLSKLLIIGGICIILLGISSQAHAENPLLQQTPSYSVLGPPTVSATFINQVLASNHSPAAGKGQALFDYGVKYGVDPVFALAFFMHESSFGTTGIAQYTLSLGNLRCIPLYSCYDGFSSFPTWEAGFEAWYSLIRDVYVDAWHLSTVEQIIPVYAPASDHNDVAAYIYALERAVDTWRTAQIAEFGPVSSGTTEGTTVSSIPPLMPFPADHYSILGKPTVDGAFIDQILAYYHSPAVGKGALFFAEGVKYGIDPIYALAFFMNDSILGTVGLALHTHSLGPLPTPTTAACRCQDAQGYRLYATWDDGIADWFQYIHDYYVQQLGLTTVSQIVSLYLRTHNTRAIDFAIKEIENRVDLWRKTQTQTPPPLT
jgi:Mannosyl-glycoprotein endo-beta-N-acetylglucosaminidase